MINALIFYTLVNIQPGIISTGLMSSQEEFSANTQECSFIYTPTMLGKVKKEMVCLPLLSDVPYVKNKGCSESIYFLEGYSGCVLVYMKSFWDKEITLDELFQNVHQEMTDLRGSYV